MSTLNLRKLFRLIEPEQPVEVWIVGIIKDAFDNIIWVGRTVTKKTAKEAGLVNKPLPKDYNPNHPIIRIVSLGNGLFYAITADKEMSDLHAKIPEVSPEQFCKELEESIKLVQKQMKELSACIDCIKKTIESVNSSLSEL